MEEKEIGSWLLKSKIGEGGMGEVYLARHTKLGTPAVIKALSKILTYDDVFRQRFFQEARTQAQLRHPHIAQLFDYIEQDRQAFLVIEYLEGGTLAEAIEKARGPIPILQALMWAQQALQALDMAHQRGIIHRDVKSTNILLDEHGQAKVSDFGIVKVIGGRNLTTADISLGTPQYMSPEQIRQPNQIDHRTDVYSMGIVLYELLTGKVPFDSDSDFEIRHAQVLQAPPPPREVNPKISQSIEDITLKALSKDPADRFLGCGEFYRAIKEYYAQTEGAPPKIYSSTEAGEQSKQVAPIQEKAKGSIGLKVALFLALFSFAVAIIGWLNSAFNLEQAQREGRANASKIHTLERRLKEIDAQAILNSEAGVSQFEDRTYEGALSQFDEIFTDTERNSREVYIDRYPIRISDNSSFSASISSNFDSYLYVRSPSGKISRNDDGAKGLDAGLRVDADEHGDWIIIVSSLASRRTGSYTLTIKKL